MISLDRRNLMFAGAGAASLAALPAWARIAVQPAASVGFTAAGSRPKPDARAGAQQQLAGVVSAGRRGKVVQPGRYGKRT